MATIWEILEFRDPVVLAVVLGTIAALMTSVSLGKFQKFQRTYVAMIAIIVGLIAGYGLYINRFFGWETALAILIYLVILALVARIIYGMIKRLR